MPTPACEAFPRSEVVFRGAVIDFQGVDSRRVELYRVAVHEIFKGLPAGTRQVLVDPDIWTTCGRAYGPGEILFYTRRMTTPPASRTPRPAAWRNLPSLPLLTTGGCSPTRELAKEDADLPYLRSRKGDRGWLYGKVGQNAESPDWVEKAPGLAGARIEIRQGEFQAAKVSDARGEFRFDDLQPGDYAVRVSRTGFSTVPWVAQWRQPVVPTGGCAHVPLTLAAGNSVSGTIVTATGAPVPHAFVMIGVVRNGAVTRLLADSRTDEAGRFWVGPVPVGEAFVLGLNFHEAPSADWPDGPVYAPGTTDLAQAKVFRAAAREKIGGVRIQLPTPPAKRRGGIARPLR